jgi:hypothetical protein
MKSRARIVLVVAGGLAVALIAARAVNYRRQRQVESGQFSGQYEAAIRQMQGSRIDLENKIKPGEKYIPPPVVSEAPAESAGSAGLGDITLQGISWNEEMPLALINDRLYKTGDRVAGGTIEKILPYGIILRGTSGTEQEIRLVKEKSP